MKAEYCATCGKKFVNYNWHVVYDEKANKTVKVCSEQYACQKPFVKKVVKTG